jgi:hypothetical protein
VHGDRASAGDVPATGGELDVRSAKSDRNITRDHKLRALGWRKYGERLRGHADSGRLKDEGGGPLDPGEADTE